MMYEACLILMGFALGGLVVALTVIISNVGYRQPPYGFPQEPPPAPKPARRTMWDK